MARIKKFGDTQPQNLTSINTFLIDTNPNSDYFRITEFKESFSGGKNGFLIEGSEYLLESTEIKIEILDVDGNPIYWEPGNGIPEYYEGVSKVVAVYVYNDTPIGQADITILGELKQYLDADGIVRDIPAEWKGLYNVKWERTFKVNKLLANEDKVRFYKRPKITIDEISRPIFTATPTLIQQTGLLNGTPLVPGEGVRLSTFTLPSSYLLDITDNTNWSGSILNGTVTMPNLGIVFTPSNLVTNKQLIVSNPYSSNGLAASFTNQPYTASFTYLVEDSAIGTALSGSFAKINITDLTTFVGDVARVKVFRKSQSEVSDFQFVQEIALESNEILVDLESSERNQENYGLFTPYTLDNYWVTSSNNLVRTFNQNILFNSVKLDSVGVNQFYTSKSIDITSGVEYTLDMNVKLDTNISEANYIKVYLEGTKDGRTINQEITTITSSNPYLQKTNINENIIANDFDLVKLYFEVRGLGWYISDVSLRASQETSFSPDEINFIQPVQRNLESETFDFRFEFYDINNNYIPVEVLATKTFSGGNLNVINKSINLVPTSLYFQFDSGSGTGNPMAPTAIFIDAETNFITGSITFTSRSFDIDNNELLSSQYIGEQYPGLLIDEGDNLYRLTVQNFTGSRNDIIVQYVEYTANVEGVSDSIIITRVSDGKGGVNYEIRTYNGTVIRNSDPSASLEIQAIRIDGINETNLQNGLPLGKSDYQLFVQSDSTYITLAEASSSGFVKGLQSGLTGSGDINYNAVFNRDSIDGQITVYLIPSSSNNYSASILTSLTLTDLQDGLDAGVVLYDADTFGINPSPKLPTSESRFIPTSSLATASFYRRGTFENPISCSIEIFPSMSINSGFNAEYWINYVTYSRNPDISVVAYDEIGNIISPSVSASQGFRYDTNTDSYYIGTANDQNKQLLVNFTYIEPFTSASVSVDKLFSIVPDGLPGDEPITFIVTPSTVVIKANENGDVVSESDFLPSQTVVSVKQGNTFLTFDQDGGNGIPEKHGTFRVITNGEPNIVAGFPNTINGITEVPISPITEFLDLTGVVKYTFEYQPYYSTASLTEFVTQSFTKVSNGIAARSISISATANVVSYDGDGVVLSPEGDITLTATAYNTTGSAFFQFFKNDVELTPPTSINFGGNTLSLSSGDAATPGETAIFRVTLRDGSGVINDTIFAEDQITITGIQSGGIPYNVSLTNDNSSIFADVYDDVTFTGTGTQILASKGGTPLVAVNSFSTPSFDQLGTVIPNGEYKVTIDSKSSHITLAGSLGVGGIVPVVNDIATIGDISAWNFLRDPNTLLPLSSSAQIVYEIDIEDGKAVYYKTQSLSVQYEGAIGPGLIMRGEWTGSIDYIFDVPAKRRDAVFREISGNVHYWGTTVDLVKSLTPPYTTIPFYDGTQQSGDIDVNGWQYLGQEDFFVAAKLAIFEESFVKNTINVGNNGGAEAFANIVLAGGRVDPYIAVGQTGVIGASGDQTTAGVIGYGNTGIFLGTKVTGSIKTPMMSLANTGQTRYMRWDGSQLELSGILNAGGMKLGPDVNGTNDGLFIGTNNYWYDTGNFKVGATNNYMEWDGATLVIKGSIRQTAAGEPEGRVLGAWDSNFEYLVNDIVSHNGRTWYCILAHNSGVTPNDEPLVGSNYTTYWGLAADAGTSGTAGAAGAAGPGVVYRGPWADGVEYFKTSTRTDVVKGTDNQYYIAKSTYTPSGTSTRPVDGASYTTFWDTFGATFSSVATNILLAQDASITRGLVIGTDGLTNGFIRSTGADDLTTGTAPGFYLQQDGRFRFGQNVVPGNSYIYYNDNVLEIRGKLLTDANEVSEIGNWKVQDGNFQDSTDSIVLNANAKSIQIYDTGGTPRVEIKQGNLSTITGGSSVSINPISSTYFNNTVFSTPGSINTSSIELDNTGFSVSAAGTYTVASVSWGGFVSLFAQASFTYQGYFQAYVSLRIMDSIDLSGNIIDILTLVTQDATISNNEDASGYSFFEGYKRSITFPSIGTYYAHVITEIYGFNEFGSVTLFGEADAGTEVFTIQLEQLEIGQNGFLVIADEDNYVKIERTTTDPMIDIKTNGSGPGLQITNANISATAKAIEVLAGDVSLSGAGNNLIVNGGYIGTEGTTDGVRMGIEGGKSRLSGQDWPSQSENVATARLRPGSTVLGIAGRELIFDSSTIRVKNNIEDYPNSAYESIKKIRPVLYTPLNIIDSNTYETGGESDYSSYPMPNPKEYIGKMGGFIAEWLDEDPELRRYVSYGVSGSVVTTDSLSYDKIVVPLTKAVQVLMHKVEALEAKISSSLL